MFAADPLDVSTLNEMLERRGLVDAADLHYRIWWVSGWLKHRVGLHTFIPLERWDLESGSMQYAGYVCWHCEERRP